MYVTYDVGGGGVISRSVCSSESVTGLWPQLCYAASGGIRPNTEQEKRIGCPKTRRLHNLETQMASAALEDGKQEQACGSAGWSSP